MDHPTTGRMVKYLIALVLALCVIPVSGQAEPVTLSVEFKVKLGPVTILGLTQTADGRLKLLAAEGESIAGPTFRIGNTNSRIRFAKGPAEFMDAWCTEGPTHHVALGVGRQLGRIRKVADLLGLELAVVQ